jgi:nitroreductase
MAPSLHNAQPWQFRVTPTAIELHADPTRRLPCADPDDRELRLGCGAALYGLRLALEHVGVRPLVTLLPGCGDPPPLARVRRGGRPNPATRQTTLYRAITSRRTNRRPFLPYRVPDGHIAALTRSVQPEQSWLQVVDRSISAKLQGMVKRAYDAQEGDPSFRAEMQRWTGVPRQRVDGVPVGSAGPRREVHDEWVLRDYGGMRSPCRMRGKDFEHDPLLVVLCSYSGDPIDDLHAGQALQRLLLTATSLGLSASFVAQVTEVPATRQKLRSLLGGSLYPQMLLRVGYGVPVPPKPRRHVEDLLFDEDEMAATEPEPARTSRDITSPEKH